MTNAVFFSQSTTAEFFRTENIFRADLFFNFFGHAEFWANRAASVAIYLAQLNCADDLKNNAEFSGKLFEVKSVGIVADVEKRL